MRIFVVAMNVTGVLFRIAFIVAAKTGSFCYHDCHRSQDSCCYDNQTVAVIIDVSVAFRTVKFVVFYSS